MGMGRLMTSVQEQRWLNDPVVREFHSWMSTQGTAQRGLVLRQLQTHFDPSRQEIVRMPVNVVSIYAIGSEDTLYTELSKQGMEKAASNTEMSEK